MVATFPPGVKAEGNAAVVYVPTLADPTDILVSEVTGGTALDISYYLKAGQFQPGGEQAKGDDRRYGSKQTYEELGRDKPSIADIQYIVDPQAADADPENEAYETLVDGATGYLVVRYGLDVDTAFAAAQKVWAYPVKFGAQRITPLGDDDEFAKFTVTQAVAVVGPVQKDVVLATS